MEATASHAQDEAIVVSDNTFPAPMRLIFIGLGIALSINLLVELGPALWPPTFLTLFFGFIILGGLSVMLGLVAFSAFGSTQKWEIQPERLTITYQLFNQTSVKIYGLEDLHEGEVRERYDSDGPNTYFLVFRLPLGRKVQTCLPSTPLLLAVEAFLSAPIATLRGATSERQTSLISPRFTKHEDAEKALAHLMGR